MLVLLAVCALFAALAPAAVQAQTYLRRNNFGIFTQYSADSSHMIMGWAENRTLLNFGLSYSRSLFYGRAVDFQYLAEFRPIIVESDPQIRYTITTTMQIVGYAPQVYVGTPYTTSPVKHCQPGATNYVYTAPYVTETETIQETCISRKYTYGEGLSPVGFKLNFLTRRRVQPVIAGVAGYMLSTAPIPVPTAGSFNFTFEFGAGVEIYRSRQVEGGMFSHRSLCAEYRYHHLSNDYTSSANPGVDSGVLQLTYAFGR